MMISAYDHLMIHHAKARGSVLVDVDGRWIDATLVSWRSKRPSGQRRSTARVEFATGRLLSVPCSRVSLPDGVAA